MTATESRYHGRLHQDSCHGTIGDSSGDPGLSNIHNLQDYEPLPIDVGAGPYERQGSSAGQSCLTSTYNQFHEGATILEQSEKDILPGRGGGVNSHPANRRLIELTRQYKGLYNSVSKGEKRSVSAQVVSILKSEGYRFLQRSEATGQLTIMSDKLAVDKTSRVIRDDLRLYDNQPQSISGTTIDTARPPEVSDVFGNSGTTTQIVPVRLPAQQFMTTHDEMTALRESVPAALELDIPPPPIGYEWTLSIVPTAAHGAALQSAPTIPTGLERITLNREEAPTWPPALLFSQRNTSQRTDDVHDFQESEPTRKSDRPMRRTRYRRGQDSSSM
jgi:hypothetical protein